MRPYVFTDPKVEIHGIPIPITFITSCSSSHLLIFSLSPIPSPSYSQQKLTFPQSSLFRFCFFSISISLFIKKKKLISRTGSRSVAKLARLINESSGCLLALLRRGPCSHLQTWPRESILSRSMLTTGEQSDDYEGSCTYS